MDAHENALKPSFWDKTWVKYGLIGAGISIAISIVFYVVDDKWLADQMLGLIPLALMFVTAIMAAAERRKMQSGYLAYSQGVKTSLAAFSVSMILSTLFTLLLYFVIDTNLLQRIIKFQLAKAAEDVRKGEMTLAQYAMVEKQFAEYGENLFLFGALGAVIVFIIVGLVIFLISSAILRREPANTI